MKERLHDLLKNGIPNIPSFLMDEIAINIPNTHKTEKISKFWVTFCNAIHMRLHLTNDCRYFDFLKSWEKKGDQLWGGWTISYTSISLIHPTWKLNLYMFVAKSCIRDSGVKSTKNQVASKKYTTITSCLSTHPFKYAFFGKKIRVQDLLVEHVGNHHFLKLLKFFCVWLRGRPLGSRWEMIPTIS